MSADNCGCDLDLNYVCERHQIETLQERIGLLYEELAAERTRLATAFSQLDIAEHELRELRWIRESLEK